MKGRCNCNNVNFEVSGHITKLYQCHCKLCQKQSGSTSNTATIIHESDFKWVSGIDSITHWKKDSGFTSDFCKICGSPVPNRLRDTSFIWIPMGLVEDVDAKVVVHICCESKAQWDRVTGDVSTLDGMPASVDSFIKSLQSSDI
jgi:hypothetical protein